MQKTMKFSKMIETSVSREVYNLLNEAWYDKAAAMGANIGRGITGSGDRVDSNAYSKAKDQQRQGKKINKRLGKLQGTVTKRFNARIAPLLAKHGVDSNTVLQSLNNTIAQKMQNVQNVNMNDHTRQWNDKGGNKGGAGNNNQAQQNQNTAGGGNPPQQPVAGGGNPQAAGTTGGNTNPQTKTATGTAHPGLDTQQQQPVQNQNTTGDGNPPQQTVQQNNQGEETVQDNQGGEVAQDNQGSQESQPAPPAQPAPPSEADTPPEVPSQTPTDVQNANEQKLYLKIKKLLNN